MKKTNQSDYIMKYKELPMNFNLMNIQRTTNNIILKKILNVKKKFLININKKIYKIFMSTIKIQLTTTKTVLYF